MSFKSNEERLADLEKMVAQMTEILVGANKQQNGLIRVDCMLYEQVLSTYDVSLALMRFLTTIDVIPKAFQQPLRDALSRSEMQRDFMAAQLNALKAGNLPPSPPPGD
jgi:hypothetical protein